MRLLFWKGMCAHCANPYAGIRRIMRAASPGMMEYELEAEFHSELAARGVRRTAFPSVIRYVWHREPHHLGLDTHDVGGYQEPMAENMVLTVDAGIYVREWGIGLRIEDNVLVTADGCENLSSSIPVTIKEIETLMAEKND